MTLSFELGCHVIPVNSNKDGAKQEILALIRETYPSIHEWLQITPRCDWEYKYSFLSEPWGITAYVVIHVLFECKADAAMFRLFFAEDGNNDLRV